MVAEVLMVYYLLHQDDLIQLEMFPYTIFFQLDGERGPPQSSQLILAFHQPYQQHQPWFCARYIHCLILRSNHCHLSKDEMEISSIYTVS